MSKWINNNLIKANLVDQKTMTTDGVASATKNYLSDNTSTGNKKMTVFSQVSSYMS